MRKSKHFQHVFKQGKRIENGLVRIYYAKPMGAMPKIAFVTSKKLGNACKRNQHRRRLIEICRHNKPYLNQMIDVIVVAKGKLMAVNYESADADLQSLFNRI
jgi:ribonuclease P protein component